HAERPISRRAAQHRPDTLLGRRHDRQAVTPLPLAERGENSFRRVDDRDVGCSGGRETALNRGWPERGASRLYCSEVHEAGFDRGWPERGASRLRTADLARAGRSGVRARRLTEQFYDLLAGLAGFSAER